MQKKNTALVAATAIAAAGLCAATVARADTADVYFDQVVSTDAAATTQPVSLTEAIDAAQTELGGRALAARLEPEKGDFVYAVLLTANDGALQEAYISPETGEVKLIDPNFDATHDADDHDGAMAGNAENADIDD